jgi:Acetyltransferase (GNAT) domain
MASITLRRLDPADEGDRSKWRDLLTRADGATLFHDPDFLAYHGDRFDEFHLGCFRGGLLIGVIPLAITVADGVKVARSPYGGSVGGPIFSDPHPFGKYVELLGDLVALLKGQGVKALVVVPPVPLYYKAPSDTLIFAMLSQGFKAVNSELTSFVPLDPAMETEIFDSRARNMARKAEKLGVRCEFRGSRDDFWAVMAHTFAKHGVPPTHSFDQWCWLQDRLPDAVWVDVAYLDDVPVAGIGHFKLTDDVDSSFYLASDPEQRQSQALSLLVHQALIRSRGEGFRIFDFGGSSVRMIPQESVLRFKESFGARGMLRHTYRLDFA